MAKKNLAWACKLTPVVGVMFLFVAVLVSIELLIDKVFLDTSTEETPMQKGPFSEIFIKNEDLEGNCAYCGFEYTYDEHKICAHSNGDKSSFYYTIPYSIVTQFALNFGEIWFYVYPMYGQKVASLEVCSDDLSACSLCNEVFYDEFFLSFAGWTHQLCTSSVYDEENGEEGNKVKITLFTNDVAFCGLQVYGYVFREDAVRQLDATFPIGSPLNPATLLSNAIDQRVNSTASQCFTSAQKTGGWASIVIPHSMVTHVALLNSDDERIATIEGVAVFVCLIRETDKCLPCGITREVNSGSWVTVHCTGGMIVGNKVKLVHSYDRLTFCEIEVYGKELERGLGTISAIRLDWMHGWFGGNESCSIDNYKQQQMERSKVRRVQLTLTPEYPKHCVNLIEVYICPNKTHAISRDSTDLKLNCNQSKSDTWQDSETKATLHFEGQLSTVLLLKNIAGEAHIETEVYGELLDDRERDIEDEQWSFFRFIRS